MRRSIDTIRRLLDDGRDGPRGIPGEPQDGGLWFFDGANPDAPPVQQMKGPRSLGVILLPLIREDDE